MAHEFSDNDSDFDLLLLTAQALHWKKRHVIVNAPFEVEMGHDVVIGLLVNTVHDWHEGKCKVLPFHAEISGQGVGAQ